MKPPLTLWPSRWRSWHCTPKNKRNCKQKVLFLPLSSLRADAPPQICFSPLLSLEHTALVLVDEAVGNEPPTYADVPKLEYAKYVGLEALRLVPPVPNIPKFTEETTTITSPLAGEVTIPKGSNQGIRNIILISLGTFIGINVYALHHNPHYWTEPDKFKPSRWDSRVTNPPEPKHRSAFLPFSLGQRSCIGKLFAELELTVALARMVQCYNFAVPSGTTQEKMLAWKPMLTATPLKDIELIVTKRTH